MDEIYMLFIYLAFIVLAGFAGGVARSLHENRQKTPIVRIIADGLIGIAGAFGIVFLSLSVNQVALSGQFDIKSIIFIISSCVVAGFLSGKVLSKISKQFDEKIDKVREEAEEAKEEAKEAKEEALEASNQAMKYSEALSLAETALNTKSNADVTEAIDFVEKVIDKFKEDRTLNIYLGRLYRKKGDLNSAIIVLRNFISVIEDKIDSPRTNMYKTHAAVAYFNIACYHALLAVKHKQNDEKERLMKEIKQALDSAIKFYPEYEKMAREDPDLKIFYN